jgi:hypothetical protein
MTACLAPFTGAIGHKALIENITGVMTPFT